MIAVDAHGRLATRYVDAGGRPGLDVDALLDGLDPSARLYVRGPRPLIEAVRLGAAARGWPPDRVRFESFGAQVSPSDRPFHVRLWVAGITLPVPVGAAILGAMPAAGVWTPFECR